MSTAYVRRGRRGRWPNHHFTSQNGWAPMVGVRIPWPPWGTRRII